MSEEAIRRPVGIGTLLGLGIVIASCLTLAMTPHASLPYWDADPAVQIPSVTSESPGTGLAAIDAVLSSTGGVGPTGSMMLAGFLLVGAALLLFLHPPPLLATGLALGGSVVVVLHGVVLKGGELESLRVGSSWLAAVWGGLALWSVGGAHPEIRRVSMLLALGVVVMLWLRGMLQVYVEHPLTMEHFEQNKETFFAAKGWDTDSAAARVYERRLSKGVATTWFALSNVTAGFAAAGVMGFGLLAAGAWMTRRWAQLALSALMSVSGLWLLVLTDSKGGWGALALGVAAICVLWMLGRSRSWLRGMVLLGVLVAPVVLVAARGVVGSEFDERSLFFRSQYQQGAMRVFADNSLLGVGAGDFRNSYIQAKPLTAPEDVTSAHGIWADWLAMLGLGGVGWIVLLGLGLWKNADGIEEQGDVLQGRRLIYLIGITISLAIACSIFLSRGESLLTSLAFALDSGDPPADWAGGVSLLLVIGFGVLWSMVVWVGRGRGGSLRTMERAAICGVAIVLVAHAQVEMTLMQPASAPLCGLLIGAGLAGGTSRTGRAQRLVSGSCAGVLGLLVLWLVLGVGRLESALADGARRLSAVSSARLETQDAGNRGGTGEVARVISGRRDVFPAGTPATPEGVSVALAEARSSRWLESLDDLERGLGESPVFPREATLKFGRMLLRDRSDSEVIERSRNAAGRVLDRDMDDLGGLRLLGAVGVAAGDPAGSREALERVASLDRTALTVRLRLMRLAVDRGDPAGARRWADETLKVNGRLWLDPARQLTDSERNEALRWASEP